MVAGPSEVVLADKFANFDGLLDLIAQAEHDILPVNFGNQ